MSSDQNQLHDQGTQIHTLCASCYPKSILQILRPQWFIPAYFIARIILETIVIFSGYILAHSVDNKTTMIVFVLIVTLARIILPSILLILFFRRRYSFLKGTIILAALDAISLISFAQSIASSNFNLDSLSLLSYTLVFFHIMSIVVSVYVNNSKFIREYCSHTPSSDRQSVVEDSNQISNEDLKKLVGLRGWLGLFTVYLCLIILLTIATMTWVWTQIDARSGTYDFGSNLSTAVFTGVLFYIFPLISLIRLSRRRIDFRNSYITGTIIDIIMFLVLLVVPDGKILWPYLPYVFLGILLMIAWCFYLFLSKRVLLSCTNGKPDKGARIDGYKWRKLY